MKIKTKLTLGVGLLFLLIILLAAISARQVWKLSEETKSILKANYHTLDYVRHMFIALDNIQTDTNAISIFRENLLKQAENITEVGEKEVTERLKNHFGQLLETPENKALPAEIRKDLNEIMHLNMSAILQKSKTASTTAEMAIIWIGITGILCFLIAFYLLVKIPRNIGNPVQALTESIRQIAGRNYDQRVHFKSGSEFSELAEAFNTMAAKLQEYENSNLSKILFQKKRTEALIEQMHEPIIGLDEQQKVLFANGEALRLLYLKKEEIVGKPAGEVSLHNDLFRALTSDLGSQPLDKAEPLKIFADGKESWFEKEVIGVEYSGTGEAKPRRIGDVIILKNVTEFREMDAAKTSLIRSISNELRQPVTSLLNTLEHLEGLPDTTSVATQTASMAKLREEGERLLKITGTLQNLSQVESGNIGITPQELNIAEVVNYALETVKNQAVLKHVGIVVKIEEDLPPLMADSDKTAWVLVNFLVNAIRYSPEKSEVIVEVRRENGSVRFSVQDFGKGIEGKYKDRVFERYFRVPGSDKQGIGLALAIGKEFILAQGGTIGVETEYGSGSKFWFRLKMNQLA